MYYVAIKCHNLPVQREVSCRDPNHAAIAVEIYVVLTISGLRKRVYLLIIQILL